MPLTAPADTPMPPEPAIQPEPIPEPRVPDAVPVKPIQKTVKKPVIKKPEKPKKKVKKAEKKDDDMDLFGLNEDVKEDQAKKKKQKTSDSLNLNKDKDLIRGSSAETPITDPNSDYEHGAPAIGQEMSISILDRVRRLLEEAWRVPLRASEGGPLIVTVNMHMNQDGTVREATIMHQSSTIHHPAYTVACDSALRAVNGFRTQPLPFLKKDYAMWEFFTFRFIRE